MAAPWPKNAIPTEIFSNIVLYLPRSSVQSMRLVDKEFEQKVSHDLFQTVVVPFRPEIYGIAEEPSVTNRPSNSHDEKRAAVMLQDKGMRVFQGFGRHIYRFGMSFEFDYSALTTPPIKSDQEALTTFWGIYRWPFKKYHRYQQLEGLEQVADETRTMTRALHYISNAKELGLSIDGGLGWLAGPDTNSKVQFSSRKPDVFGVSRFRPEDMSRRPFRGALSGPLSVPTDSSGEIHVDARVIALIHLLCEAGYEDLAQSVRTIFEKEGGPECSNVHIDLSSISNGGEMSNSPTFLNPAFTESFLRRLGYFGTQLDRLKQAFAKVAWGVSELSSFEINNIFPLKPNCLTTGQKELLLETEWAQRAFMQSYTIAIIDNSTTFRGITTLFLARLPSRHLSNLRRGDFWDSLPQLRNISLAIIPDWREVVKQPTTLVDDVRVQPSRAISGVYQLLKDHIARKRSVKSLHFEWLCGGEEAIGMFARNQLILAAPVLPQSIDLIHELNPQVLLLELPHLEDLSLKNCWISPHILVCFIQRMKSAALTSLTLKSVSLTAASITNKELGNTYMQQTAVPQFFTTAQSALVAQMVQKYRLHAITSHTIMTGPPIANPGPGPPNLAAPWPNQPRYGSWTHIIDRITPGETTAQFLHSQNLGPAPRKRPASKLQSILFESCGYVRMPLDFDQTPLEHDAHEGDTPVMAKRRSELAGFMMKSMDNALGTIVNNINETERKWLEIAWRLKTGWGEAHATLATQAAADGIRFPGFGRFGGRIDRLGSVSSPLGDSPMT